MRPAAAAEDFDAAAELLRAAGRRPEAEIEAEKGAVAMMAAEAWKIMEVEMFLFYAHFTGRGHLGMDLDPPSFRI